ncbi:MAG TPA: LLM class F420-dependent oxidoreductase [Ktedonobacteraceae bacterium]
MAQAQHAQVARVGVQLHPQHTNYQSFAEAVQKCEEAGVDSIWTWDHFFPLYGPSSGPHFEGWTLLTAMATLTQRAEIGLLVTCNTYRNPALLSNMAKTVDHISQGRLILGLGAGWFERDYSEYGYDFGTPASRLAALEESLKIIKHRWEVDVPQPLHKIPIMIGGGGEKVTLKITARYADMWHGFGNPEAIKHKMEVLDNWCREVGRDPHAIERGCGTQGGDSDETRTAYVQAGATHLILGMGEPWDYQAITKLVQWRDNFNS